MKGIEQRKEKKRKEKEKKKGVSDVLSAKDLTDTGIKHVRWF